jgi:transposase
MSLKATPVPPVPEDTARVARASFRKGKGSPWIALRDELGVLYQDTDFATLFAIEGRPAEAPWRLALVTCFQFAEGLSDLQAADAVRSRIDWKYALSLPLDSPGFDHSVLSEFRTRLIEGQAEALLFDKVIGICRERKWLKTRGRQRTDSTHVLASVRSLNRLENIARTFQHALNSAATVAPDWMRSRLENEWSDWPERYDHRLDEYRMPKEESARARLAVQIDTPCSTLWRPSRLWRVCFRLPPSQRCGAFGCNSTTLTTKGRNGALRQNTAGRQARHALFRRTTWRRVTGAKARPVGKVTKSI